ncbi:esterase-like activity of phytase-domain-containing protein [Gymnopilus junonius]|uniref:Esterase-like activity of phytase-domain-containing protein n=1 Tax=Gymnopilus junonius TaxID=109634 RepID=A0A9P5NFJ7_GYMJU|nr:esterase-like activity of phytase-domain-containing protein [Gymnopilus junonius]
MRPAFSRFLPLLSLASHALAVPSLQRVGPRAEPAAVGSAVVDGVIYINKGLVGFGLIPSNFTDSTGDTIGGYGGAIAFKLGTFSESDGVFSGTLLARPDRGFNVDGPIDYQARQHEIDFVFTPYYGTANLTFQAAQQTLQLPYRDTTLMFERQDKTTSGLDGDGVRTAQSGFLTNPLFDPVMPTDSTKDDRLVLDVEGVVANSDGTFWISDEYGPYIYRFSADGNLIQTIQPPQAVLPLDKKGNLNFTSLTNPDTGRSPNQGFEGLTLDADDGILYAMLQSALIQDGGDNKNDQRFTRLFAFDVSDPDSEVVLVGEWVVPLPIDSKSNTQACSEIHFVSPGVFFALSRDGDGRGGNDDKSSYKQADLFSIAQATDIHGSKFDDPSNPIATKGKLDKSITAAEYVGFVKFIDPVQLARFGLHNGKPDDPTLIDGKWESLALAPVNDPAFPNDYFLFTAADNDFLSTQGVSLGVPFNAGLDVDNQMMVWRVTLPSVAAGSVERSIGI